MRLGRSTANLDKDFYGFEPDFFQQNLLRIVDDVISVIKGSIELWPSLVEICYFHKNRKGLPQVRVKNKRRAARKSHQNGAPEIHPFDDFRTDLCNRETRVSEMQSARQVLVVGNERETFKLANELKEFAPPFEARSESTVHRVGIDFLADQTQLFGRRRGGFLDGFRQTQRPADFSLHVFACDTGIKSG